MAALAAENNAQMDLVAEGFKLQLYAKQQGKAVAAAMKALEECRKYQDKSKPKDLEKTAELEEEIEKLTSGAKGSNSTASDQTDKTQELDGANAEIAELKKQLAAEKEKNKKLIEDKFDGEVMSKDECDKEKKELETNLKKLGTQIEAARLKEFNYIRDATQLANELKKAKKAVEGVSTSEDEDNKLPLQDRISALGDRLRSSRREVNSLQAQLTARGISTDTKALSDARAKIAELEAIIKDLRNGPGNIPIGDRMSLAQTKQQVRQLEGDKANLEKRLRSVEQDLRDCRQQKGSSGNERLGSDLDLAEERIRTLEGEVKNANDARIAALERCDEEKIEVQKKAQKYYEDRWDGPAADSLRVKALQEEVESLESKLEGARTRADNAENATKGCNDEKKELNARIKDLQMTITHLPHRASKFPLHGVEGQLLTRTDGGRDGGETTLKYLQKSPEEAQAYEQRQEARQRADGTSKVHESCDAEILELKTQVRKLEARIMQLGGEVNIPSKFSTHASKGAPLILKDVGTRPQLPAENGDLERQLEAAKWELENASTKCNSDKNKLKMKIRDLKDDISEKNRRIAEMDKRIRDFEDEVGRPGKFLRHSNRRARLMVANEDANRGNDDVPTAEGVDFAILRAEVALQHMVAERGVYGFIAGDTDTALRAAREATRLADRARLPDDSDSQDGRLMGRAYFWLGVATYYSGDTQAAEGHFDTSNFYKEWLEPKREQKWLAQWVRTVDAGIDVAKNKEDYWTVQHLRNNMIQKRTKAKKSKAKSKKKRNAGE